MRNKPSTLSIGLILSHELGGSISSQDAANYWQTAKVMLTQRSEADAIIDAIQSGQQDTLTSRHYQALKQALAEAMIREGFPIDRQKVGNGRLLKNCMTQE